jgi:DNA modification methylase
MTPTIQIFQGDCRAILAKLPAESVQTCVTSPPYYALRNYNGPPLIWGQADCDHDFVQSRRYTEQSAASARGESFHEAGPENSKRLKEARWRTDSTCAKCGAWKGQLGLEPTPEMFVTHLVEVFRHVWRVLKPDGTLWLNLGDSYAQSGGSNAGLKVKGEGLKQKDLIGIPWMTAFALRASGWYLRSDIIWSKPNCMPESVTDRVTRSHEYIFFLSKSDQYFYDAAAIRNPPSEALIKQIEQGYNGQATKDFIGTGVQDASETKSRIINGYRKRVDKQRGHSRRHEDFNDRWDAMTKEEQMLCGSNKRSVWTVAPANYPGAHFATWPPELIKPCILAGSPAGGTVLDPFAGSGTTGEVAIEYGRNFIGCELNDEYMPLIKDRLKQPGLMLVK